MRRRVSRLKFTAALLVSICLLVVLPYFIDHRPGEYGLPVEGPGRKLVDVVSGLVFGIVLIASAILPFLVRRSKLCTWTAALLLTSVVVAIYGTIYHHENYVQPAHAAQEAVAFQLFGIILPTLLALLSLSLRWGAIAVFRSCRWLFRTFKA